MSNRLDFDIIYVYVYPFIDNTYYCRSKGKSLYVSIFIPLFLSILIGTSCPVLSVYVHTGYLKLSICLPTQIFIYIYTYVYTQLFVCI